MQPPSGLAAPLLTCIAASFFLGLVPAGAQAHAGHDHMPEISAPVTQSSAPRFYAHSTDFDIVLALPSSPAGQPLMYLASAQTNTPLSKARLTLEYLTGGAGTITAQETESLGVYGLTGLTPSETTATLTVEVSRGDLLEILTLDGIRTADASAASGSPHPASGSIPYSIAIALAAMNLVLVSVAVLALILWRRDVRRAALGPPTIIPFLLGMGLGLVLGQPIQVAAHAGEDHSGDALISASAPPSNSLHYLPIESQFSADIRTSTAEVRMLPNSMQALGQVEIRPDLRAIVTSPVEGRLILDPETNARLPIQGESVKKSQLLVVIEQVVPAAERVTLTTERAQIKAELGQAQQELELATKSRLRAERLANVIPEGEVDQARTSELVAKYKVQGLNRRLDILAGVLATETTSPLRQIPILSPITGVIHQSHATQGEYVPIEKTLFEIVNLDRVFVGADVFETDLARIQGSLSARITVEAYPGIGFSGTLHSVALEISRETRSAHVLFAVDNPELRLRGGMFANISIESAQRQRALVIPKTAVLNQDGVRMVYRKVTPEHYEARIVRITEYRGDDAVVADGLNPGDRVATSGLYQIRMAPTVSRVPLPGKAN